MRGAVAAGHPLTAEAGARVLAAGGNAVDACIAAAFVSWVAESPLTGPGAGGFMLVHRARDGRDFLLDFFAAVPGRGARGRPSSMRAVDIPFGSGNTTQRFLVDAPSCAVPGMVAGLEDAHRRYATIPWPDLVRPAAELARTGVELSAPQALLHAVLDPVLRQDPDGRRVYGNDGPIVAGGRVVMSDLAETLEILAANGARAFYHGEIAVAIAREVASRGGLLAAADLAAYRVIHRRPVRARYRDHEVISNPPPSSGGVLIGYALSLLDSAGVGGTPGSADALARLADVARESTRARTVRFESDLYRGGLARRLLADDCIAAGARAVLGGPAGEVGPERVGLPSTTHVSVVDTRGNAASLSSSTGCGSGVVVPGTGVHLNNMLGEVDLNPTGKAAVPGRRLTSMMAPTLLLRQGRASLVLGSAGSERLRGAIVQTVVNVLDHRLTVREAIDRPRVHLDGSELHLEGGTDPEVATELERRGYRVVRWPGRERNLYFGGVSAVGLGAGAALEAAGDPRRGGAGVVVA